MKRNAETQNTGGENAENSTRIYFYIALGALVAAAAAFGCAFIPRIGVYMLIAAALLELASLAFLSTQKKKHPFRGVKYLTVAAYALFGATLALFLGGAIYAGLRG